jgi:type IV pilus assembly protein PilB
MEDTMGGGVKKLGDMLIEAGLIDDFQLQTALSHQRNWGGKLGSILIELQFIREEDLARVMAEKLHIPYVNLFDPEIPENIIRMIKADIAKKYHVVPVKKEAGALVLAMFDPLDAQAADEIRFITGLTIKPALSIGSEISDAIRKYYDGEQVDRSHAKALYHRREDAPGKMEILRGRDLITKNDPESEPESAMPPKEAMVLQTLNDTKLRLDALIALLIEKKLISREDLVSMIYQKKMGL